ncbi:DUF3888 domain-containing protein [Aneurinibacillus aneurinilyticus]|uniref:DUF3888 domain-containing protein n=1 Tax=Aneurinibacillus aneurinilyticus TaxID=1391 RepID=UPI003526716D
MNKTVIAMFLTMGFVISSPFTCHAESIYTPPEQSREELYQDIFISLLMPHIQKQINNYYTKVLTTSPVVYPYFVYVLKAERIGDYRSFDFLVKLKVIPVIGPHISVGIDHLIFKIRGSGDVELKKFEHIKTENLPENWKHMIKEQL